MLYRFSATHPNCAQAQLIWQHGTFTQNSNGSLTLTPFEGDGRQLVQNGCTQQSQTLISYDQQEYMQGFYVRNDWHFGQGGIYLEMYEFDGTPKPWLWQTHNPPEMLPTQQLHKKVSPCSLAFLHTQDIVTDALCFSTRHRLSERSTDPEAPRSNKHKNGHLHPLRLLFFFHGIKRLASAHFVLDFVLLSRPYKSCYLRLQNDPDQAKRKGEK